MTNTVFTFSLPEDVGADTLTVFEATSKAGTYFEHAQEPYRYGSTKLEVDIDQERWYKLQFSNSGTGLSGPMSEPVFGGTVVHGAPFLAVSTTFDGANYATTEEVYQYSGLTPEDVAEGRVSQALRRARAVIDFRCAEMDFDRLDVFEQDVRRRKYNAALRILKEAEINMALGNVYQNMADDVIIKNRREGDDHASGGTAIGGASVGGDNLGERSENIVFLATLSDRYFITAEQLLATIDANSVRLIGGDLGVRIPRFLYPFNGGGFRRFGNWY